MEIHRCRAKLEGPQPKHLHTNTHLPLHTEEGVLPSMREPQKPPNTPVTGREERVQEVVVKVTAKYEAK